METIGLVGVGLLGTALAERLLAGGFAVAGHDPDPVRRLALEERGGQACASVVEVARHRRILLSLPDSSVVAAVVSEMASHLIPGAVLLDTTTGDPEATAALGASLAERGIDYVDACVLGSSDEARAGTVLVMAGGKAEVLEANADLLRTFSHRHFHVGTWGAGARMKLVVNLVLGLNRAVLAEGLGLARALSLDLGIALDVLRSGAAWSRVMDTKGERILKRDFRPQARLRQHLKDVRLILDAARSAAARTPLSEVHRTLLERVVELGGGDEDNSAIVRAYD